MRNQGVVWLASNKWQENTSKLDDTVMQTTRAWAAGIR